MLDLALACDLKTADPAEHANIRTRHQAIKTPEAAAAYIHEVENKVHSRRKFSPAKPTSTTAALAWNQVQHSTHTDPQTGEKFAIVTEDCKAKWAARVTGAYLVISSAVWLWILFDVWSNNNYLIRDIASLFGASTKEVVGSPSFRLVAYTLIGGAMGGVINGFRSFIFWHCEHNAFGLRFVWKHFIFPIQGALLGLIIFALLRSSVSVLDGVTTSDSSNSAQALAFFGISALAGYGAHSVFRWLDYKVSQIFKIPPRTGPPANKDHQ